MNKHISMSVFETLTFIAKYQALIWREGGYKKRKMSYNKPFSLKIHKWSRMAQNGLKSHIPFPQNILDVQLIF